MNTITLVKNLLDQKNSAELSQYITTVWNHVWSGDSQSHYINIRLFKTIDKIKKLTEMKIDFRDKYVLNIGCILD